VVVHMKKELLLEFVIEAFRRLSDFFSFENVTSLTSQACHNAWPLTLCNKLYQVLI